MAVCQKLSEDKISSENLSKKCKKLDLIRVQAPFNFKLNMKLYVVAQNLYGICYSLQLQIS